MVRDLPDTWRHVPLSCVLELQRGHDLPASTRSGGTIPVIGSFGITGFHDLARYSGPGVAIGRSGAAIGKATYVPGAYWPLNTCLFVRDFKGNDPRWVHRILGGIDFAAFNSGSAQPSLNRNFLQEIPVARPPVVEQRAIVEVLGALEEKIAANAHVCNAAGALADAQFAARAGVWVSDGTTFAEVADIGGGGTPSTADATLWNGEIAWATPTDVTALRAPYLLGTSRTITAKGLASCASPLYPMGSILMTSRATIGAFAIAERPTAVNQGFIVVNARQPSSQWWFFHQMRARVSEFLSYANGATFLELSRGQFRQLPVWTAEDSVVAEFDAVADVLHRRASAAMQETAQLALLRDTLLPELMSGRLRVKDAERVVEDAV